MRRQRFRICYFTGKSTQIEISVDKVAMFRNKLSFNLMINQQRGMNKSSWNQKWSQAFSGNLRFQLLELKCRYANLGFLENQTRFQKWSKFADLQQIRGRNKRNWRQSRFTNRRRRHSSDAVATAAAWTSRVAVERECRQRSANCAQAEAVPGTRRPARTCSCSGPLRF